MSKTKIEWSNNVWNPITGCDKISAGCRSCYAERMSKRLAGRFGYPLAPDNFKVTCHPERINEPLKWKNPKRIFVCSMSDFFHKDVPVDFLLRLYVVMRLCQQHTFQILTKRPDRILDVFSYLDIWEHFPQRWRNNIWYGVSVENQKTADERIPILLKIPAKVRFLSIEPLLEDLGTLNLDGIHWVIVGGESGSNARPMNLDWVRNIRDQSAGVPFFFKQMLVNEKKVSMPELDGKVWDEMPQ